jgi:NAD dependent epimerase/dehydratase family
MSALANASTAMGVLHGRRIAVTDGVGFLARVAVGKLQERGCTDVTVPRRARCDLSRRDHIEGLFDKYRPHLLLHLAITVDSSANHRDLAESSYKNVMTTTQSMEASSRHGVEKMICIDNASSYPANAPVPLGEQDLFKGQPDPARAIHGIANRVSAAIRISVRVFDPHEFLRRARQLRAEDKLCDRFAAREIRAGRGNGRDGNQNRRQGVCHARFYSCGRWLSARRIVQPEKNGLRARRLSVLGVDP